MFSELRGPIGESIAREVETELRLVSKPSESFSKKIAAVIDEQLKKELGVEGRARTNKTLRNKTILPLKEGMSTVEYVGLDTVARGKLPYKLTQLAMVCNHVGSNLLKFREKVEKLTDEERNVLLQHAPSNLNPILKGILSREWDSEHAIKAVTTLSGTIISASKSLEQTRGKVLDVLGSFVSKVAETFVSAETQQHFLDVMGECVSNMSKHTAEATVGFVYPKAMEALHSFVDKNISVLDSIADQLINNLQLVSDTFEKSEKFLETLPPDKLMATLFESLDELSKVSLKASQESVDELTKQKLEAYHAGASKYLPTPALNAAFTQLFDPTSYQKPTKERYLELLGGYHTKQLTIETEKEINEEYSEFCQRHKLTEQSPESLTLIKAAFFADKLHHSKGNENDPVPALTQMILIHPKEFLDDNGCSTENLLKQASIAYIKSNLYPTLVTTLLPDYFHTLVDGVGKLAGKDLRNEISTQLATVIVEKGLKALADPNKIARGILKALEVDFSEFTKYSVSLEKSALRKSEKSQKQLTEEALNKINESLKNKTGELPRLIKPFISSYLSPLHSISQEIEGLSNRKNFGLAFMLVAGRLNSGLKNPESLPSLDLARPDTMDKLERIVNNVLPSYSPSFNKIKGYVRYVPSLVSKLFIILQNKLGFLNYHHLTDKIANSLKIMNLTSRVMNALAPSLASVPITDYPAIKDAVELDLEQHINKSVKALSGKGIHAKDRSLHEKTYINYLLKLDRKNLLKILKVTNLESESDQIQLNLGKKVELSEKDIHSLRIAIIQDKEEELRANQQELDRLLTHPQSVMALKDTSAKFMNGRRTVVREISSKIVEVRKEISLIHQINDYQAALDSIKNPKIQHPLAKRYSEEQLTQLIAEATQKLGVSSLEGLIEQENILIEMKDKITNSIRLVEIHSKIKEQVAELSVLYDKQNVSYLSYNSVRKKTKSDINKIEKEIISIKKQIKSNRPDLNVKLKELEEDLKLKIQVNADIQKDEVSVKKAVSEKIDKLKKVTHNINDLKKKRLVLINSGVGFDNEEVDKLQKKINKYNSSAKQLTSEIILLKKEFETGHLLVSVREKIKFVDLMFQQSKAREGGSGKAIRKINKKMNKLYINLLQMEYGLHISLPVNEMPKLQKELETSKKELNDSVNRLEKEIEQVKESEREILDQLKIVEIQEPIQMKKVQVLQNEITLVKKREARIVRYEKNVSELAKLLEQQTKEANSRGLLFWISGASISQSVLLNEQIEELKKQMSKDEISLQKSSAIIDEWQESYAEEGETIGVSSLESGIFAVMKNQESHLAKEKEDLSKKLQVIRQQLQTKEDVVSHLKYEIGELEAEIAPIQYVNQLVKD